MKKRYRRVALRGTTCLLVALVLPALWASPGVAQMQSETQKDVSSSTIGIANTNQVNGNANGTLDNFMAYSFGLGGLILRGFDGGKQDRVDLGK